MPDAFRAEFTGERVIPGRVEDNLFNEHLARYRFAAHVLQQAGTGGRLLDAGCGAGYGTSELARSAAEMSDAAVLGIDVSEEAIAHARANYAAASNVRFEQASCTAIPAEDGAFRLIAAFEVIEHLEDWRSFLHEAWRVLDDEGMFLVSTPNRLYYAESRQKAGPNPFHVHEFTEEEFRSALAQVFPQVKILLQNHVEGIAFSETFSGAEAEGAAVEISDRNADPDGAHFFLAVCGKQPLPRMTSFVFIPDIGNVLQTRERHIALLDGEILKKNEWIEREQMGRQRMLDKVREMEAELEEHNQWAQRANAEAERRAQLVAALQEEVRQSNEWAKVRDAEAVARGQVIERLQAELLKSNEWAQNREAEAVQRGRRVEQLQDEVEQAVAWAKDREREVKVREVEAQERGRRVVQLQDEVEQAVAWAKDREREVKVREVEAQERGRRVEQLQDELLRSNEWALEREAEAGERGKRVIELQTELAQATEWAQSRDAEAEERGRRIVQLQAEVEQLGKAVVQIQEDSSAQSARLEQEMAASSAGYEAAIEQWRREKEASDRWAMETERRLSAERDAAREAFAGKEIELGNSLERLAVLQAEAEELRAQLAGARERMAMIAQSRWVKMGRMVRVGPEIDRN